MFPDFAAMSHRAGLGDSRGGAVGLTYNRTAVDAAVNEEEKKLVGRTKKKEWNKEAHDSGKTRRLGDFPSTQ